MQPKKNSGRVPASPPDLKAKVRKQYWAPESWGTPVDRELFHWSIFPLRKQYWAPESWGRLSCTTHLADHAMII